MHKGPSKPSSNKIINQDEEEVSLGKENVRAACPKDKLEFLFFETWKNNFFLTEQKQEIPSGKTDPSYSVASQSRTQDSIQLAHWWSSHIIKNIFRCSDRSGPY